MTPDRLTHPPTSEAIVSVLKNPITIRYAVDGNGLAVLPYLSDPSHYKGPETFPTIVDLGCIYDNLGFRNSMVPANERWSSENLPPRGIRILEFENPSVKSAVGAIAAIAQEDFYGNQTACYEYYVQTSQVLLAISKGQKFSKDDTAFLGLIRAGVVAGQIIGFPEDEQTLVQTKRLGGEDGRIAIGIGIKEEVGLYRPHWLIADPAGATYGSVVANVLHLLHHGYRPERVSIWNTVASHKGAEFALAALTEQGINTEIIAGGYSPGMNENYYLLTSGGTPSVRDAGDALNGFLPKDLMID